MTPILGTLTPSQVAIIVRDIEAVKTDYAKLWGTEVPPTKESGDYAVTQTEYKGGAAPDAKCKMAFFELGNVQFEIIQPNEHPSTWRDFLEENGEGLHHLAFNVEDLEAGIQACEGLGMTLTQRGNYSSGEGGYAYMDARKTLKCFIELLCTYK